MFLKLSSIIFRKPILKSTWNCLFYFNFFNFPIWYAFQSCLTLSLVSIKTIIDQNYTKTPLGKFNLALAIIYIMLMTIMWIFVLIKILKTKKLGWCNSFTEFTVGMKKSKWRVFLMNFHFVFSRFVIVFCAAFLQEFIQNWNILPFIWTAAMLVQLILNFTFPLESILQ